MSKISKNTFKKSSLKQTECLDDLDLALQWIERHPHCRFGRGAMRQYRDGYWPAMDADVFRQSVLETLEQAKRKWKVRITSARLRSVIELINQKTTHPADQWDANPNILVTRNGTLDLEKMILREHSPNDYALNALDYVYDPKADCPIFKKVLQDSFPSDAIDFFQEFAGYSLTTSTEYEIAIWLYGPPGAGKSTTVEGLAAMLGYRAERVSLTDLEHSRFALWNISGKTLLFATEHPNSSIHSEDKLNAIISGEIVNIERKFYDPTSIRSVSKILWAMNDLPKISPSSGLSRRVKIVPCRPVASLDPAVKEAVRKERAGILNWALEGLRRLRERGCFQIPDSVQKASQHFHSINDIPAKFLADYCEIDNEYRVSGSELYTAYKQWCADNGYQPASATSIAECWKRLGLVRYRSEGRTYYRGVRLKGA